MRVLEIIPPAVRTTLMDQEDSEHAMPLDASLSEVMTLLETDSDSREIRVKNIEYLRTAETNGHYDEALAMLTGS